MAGLAQIQQIDVDELAKEKVQEVERLLNSSESHKLGAVNSWLSVLKQIITAADLHRTNDKNDNHDDVKTKTETDDSIYADYSDDNEQFNAVDLTEQFASNSVKWTIRVKAFKLVHRLVQMFSNPNRLNSAKSLVMKHLSDLVRLSFVAATSPYDDLKLQGFEMFKFLINRFASIEEREFPGHSILEQYRTQVLSALKPAFNLDAPPYITAIASQVCCLWMCRGLERDPGNLKRTYQLMMTTIDKLENQSVNQHSKLYTESELEQERLDILGSWAQLYITTKELDESFSHDGNNRAINSSKLNSVRLNELVRPQITSLVDKWWEALKDYALLIMPSPKNIGTSHDNEHVYTKEVALRLFAPVWPKLILASTIWLCSEESKTRNEHSNSPMNSKQNDTNQVCDSSQANQHGTSQAKYFKFICGILMKELCRCHSDCRVQRDSLPETTTFVLRSLSLLVNKNEMKHLWIDEFAIAQEFYTILYGILINGTSSKSQHHLILRNLLDILFNLAANRVASKPENIRYSVAHLVNSIIINLKDIEVAIKVNEISKIERLMANFSIMTCNIMNVIKLAPGPATDDQQLRDNLIEIFKGILRFKANPSLGVSFLDHLKDLYAIVPQGVLASFINGLFEAKIDAISNLYGSIQCEESSGENKTLHCSIPYLEAHLKSSREDINLSDAENRQKLVADYLKILINSFPKLQEINSSGKNDVSENRKNELLDLGIKYAEELIASFPNEFKSASTPEMKQALDSAIKLQQDIKSEAETKRNAQLAKEPTLSISSNPTRPQTKIVLKADFSNFYAKKPS